MLQYAQFFQIASEISSAVYSGSEPGPISPGPVATPTPAGALYQQPPSYFDHQRAAAAAAAATAGTAAGGHSSSEQPPVDLAPDYIVGQASLYHQGYSQPV